MLLASAAVQRTANLAGVVMRPKKMWGNPETLHLNSGPEKGVITKGVFSLEEPLESLESLNSLESLENGRSLLCFPQSGGSLESLETLNSLESLENGLFWKDPFSKRPLFPKPINVLKARHLEMVFSSALCCLDGAFLCLDGALWNCLSESTANGLFRRKVTAKSHFQMSSFKMSRFRASWKWNRCNAGWTFTR